MGEVIAPDSPDRREVSCSHRGPSRRTSLRFVSDQTTYRGPCERDALSTHIWYGSMGLDAAERFLLLPATARTLEKIVLEMRFPPPAQLTRRKKIVERPAPSGFESRRRRADFCCRRACYSCALSLSSLPRAKALSNIMAAATSGNSPQGVVQRQRASACLLSPAGASRLTVAPLRSCAD